MFLLNRPEVSPTVPRGSVFGSSCNFCYLILSTFPFLAFHHALGLLLNLKIKLVQIFLNNLLNKLAMSTNFLAFFCFYLKKFSLLDPDPHIECWSRSRSENECGSCIHFIQAGESKGAEKEILPWTVVHRNCKICY